MSTSFLWLAAILTLVSALVAYLGDLLGRHVGKRKISLFKLRPRDSAIVVTSLTGGLITLFTIVVLLLSNASLQQMAKSADEVLRLQQEARTKIRDAEAQIAESQRQIQVAQDQQASLLKEIERINTTAEESRQELARLETENQTVRQDNATLRQQSTSLTNRITELTRRRAQLAREIEANSSYILEQETAIAQLRQETTQLAQTVEAYKEGDIVITDGTALASEYLPTDLTVAQFQTALLALQKEVRLPARLTASWPNAEAVRVAHEALLHRAPDRRAAVILEAGQNTLLGGTVPIRLRVVPDTIVFARDDIIHLWRLEKRPTYEEADEAARFILPLISEKAIARGSIPLMGDRRITQFDSLSLAQFLQDLLATPAPAYIAFQATTDIGVLDPLLADVNLTWRILPASPTVPAE